jgi:putative flippase GtrA
MRIERFGWNKQSLVGFGWHQALGAVCFFFDIAIIYLLMHFVHLRYPVAVTIGFMAATLLNYALTRSTIYSHSERPHNTALMYFFGTAGVLLLLTVGGTVLLREMFNFKLYTARTIVGVLVGIAGFFIDCLITFKLKR